MAKQKISEMYPDTIKWQDTVPGAGVVGGGTSYEVETGEWRVDCPEFIEEKCKQCLMCAPACPDSAIPVKDGKRGEFDFAHCKGCGICAKACPFGAIVMHKGGM